MWFGSQAKQQRLVLFCVHILKLWQDPQQYLLYFSSILSKSYKKCNNYLEYPQMLSSSSPCVTGSLVISDFTVTCLSISGPPTCQERPKYRALLMKICNSRCPGLLSWGLTSSPDLLMFQDTFEKHHLVFVKAFLEEPFFQNTVAYRFHRIWNIHQVLLYLILLSVTSCTLFSHFSFPHLSLLLV